MSASAARAEAGAKQRGYRQVEELDSVTIRFVGDSGDGMQLTGNEFSRAIAKAGHDFATHPDYPSEIRAPTGTLFGVFGAVIAVPVASIVKVLYDEWYYPLIHGGKKPGLPPKEGPPDVVVGSG